MKFRNILVLEKDKNRKGDLFCRLMADVFHALGYDEPRFDIQKSGREIDIFVSHRTECKIAVVECKAHKEKIGGDEINKFIGVLNAEKLLQKNNSKQDRKEVVGYFVSLSGFKETAIQQEEDLYNKRVILLNPSKIINELINGKILVPIEHGLLNLSLPINVNISDNYDLIVTEKGWIWVVYFTNGQTLTHFTLIHAEGKPLISELYSEVLTLDKNRNNYFANLDYLNPNKDYIAQNNIDSVKDKYFKYLENECGDIQFEGLPTDKDAGSLKVKLENIFVPLHLEENKSEETIEIDDSNTEKRIRVGNILKSCNRIAILAKPGGGQVNINKANSCCLRLPG